MANLFEHNERRVIPNWRSFGKTIILGELDSIKQGDIILPSKTTINDYLIDWRLNKSTAYASELLSAAIVNGISDNKDIVDAAKYILSNSELSMPSQISLANQIILGKHETDLTIRLREFGISSITTLINLNEYYRRIKETKSLIKAYPFNAILFVELSRYYSILGREEKSIQAMKTALHLAPNNRFILRSASRLFAHFHTDNNNYISYVHHFLRDSPLTVHDPWLTSAEISIATIRGQNSKLIKKGMAMINSGNISPFNFTELASSIGTIEMINGSSKKSRDYFNKALIDPNDNSLAQIEWASRKDSKLEVKQSSFDVRMNYEALAFEYFYNNEFDLALDYVAKWFADQPYSKRPIMFGSNLSSTILKDQGKSIDLLNAGLISHPNDPQLLNNLAYAFALNNQASKAIDVLSNVRHDASISDVTNICLKATRGLAYFRLGQIEIGRKLYIDAMSLAGDLKNKELLSVALLNFTREEIMVSSEFIEPMMDAISKIPANSSSPEIIALRNDVEELYLKNKSSYQKG